MNWESPPQPTRAGSALHLEQLVLGDGPDTAATLLQALDRPGVLGGICHGAAPLLPAVAHGMLQPVPTPLLPAQGRDAARCLYRLIRSSRPVHGGIEGRIRYRMDGDFVFGCLALEHTRDDPASLKDIARSAYEQTFAFLQRLDPPRRFRLWRIWNYMSDINAVDGSLERYRQFNLGRAQAFAQHGAAQRGEGLRAGAQDGEIPAACGIGTLDDRPGAPALLSIAFLAAARLFVQIENPRQVSAFAYPPEYGPARPMFSRAILGLPGPGEAHGGELLFVSGTASILGHRTVHRGDVAEQCRESLRNIAAVVQEANHALRARNASEMALTGLDYLVYLRRPEHLMAIQEVLHRTLGAGASVHCVQADICRDDLLVEIEATRLSPVHHG